MKKLEITKGMKIKLLGDSITHGVGGTGFCQNGEHIVNEFSRNPDGFCWAKMFSEYMSEKYGVVVLNNACTGTKIDFVINNFDTLVSPDDDIVICTIGTNNRHQFKKDGPRRDREDKGREFYNYVLELNSLLKESGKEYILIANIPASAENERDKEDFWRILHMDDINAIYKRANEKLGFNFISMYDLFSSYLKENNVELDSLLADGLHPNDDGYTVMYNLLLAALEI
jgi:lysophospholipase L1-like esterase